jgi:hypothetical protein
MQFTESVHIIGGLPPNADAFNGTKYTDIFEVQGEGAWFLYWMGTNDGTGNATVTVEACSTTGAAATTAVAFMYRASTTFDTWGSWTQATTTGFSTATTSDNMYEIFVPASEFASAGYKYARLKSVEVGTDNVDGVVVAGVVNPRYQVQPTSLID